MSLIHHLALSASSLATSASFYDGLMRHFKYHRVMTTQEAVAWEGPDFELIVYQADPKFFARKHSIYQPGFHHLALHAAEREDVDAVYAWLHSMSLNVLDAPREYPEYPGEYYAVFFTDPDNLKLEVMHH